MSEGAVTIGRVTMPPGGPHAQPPYGGPPAPPPGYGPPPGFPPPGYPQGPGPRQGYPAPNGYPGPVPNGPGGPTGTRQLTQAPGPMGPGMGMPRGYAPGAVVIDVGGTDGKKAVIGGVVAGVIGLIAIIAGISALADDGVGGGIAAILIGGLFLIPGIFVFVKRDKVFRPRKLVFEPGGIRWDDPQGAPWAIPWTELAHVSVNKHSPKQVGPESVQDKIVGAASDKIVGERAHVRLDLYPADPSFAGRHPELAHLWERQGVQGGYRMPLGSNAAFIPTIAQAMGRFAPRLYRGVNATEGFMGLS